MDFNHYYRVTSNYNEKHFLVCMFRAMMIKAFLEIKYSDISYKVTLSGAVTQ